MNRLRLVEPTMEHEQQVMAMRDAFTKNHDSFDGCARLDETASYADWLDFDHRLREKYGDGYVPSTVLLAVRNEDDKVVGIMDYRHWLSDFLLKYGGHIGYSVLPSERGHGYAGEMLSLLLERLKAMKVDKVLVVCDKDNPASAKTIQRIGGVLENEVPDDTGLGHSGLIQRYWITLGE